MTLANCLAAAQRGGGCLLPTAVIPGPPQAEPGIQRGLITRALARRLSRSLDSGFALTRAPE
jgi:hypothetical protein